ncbi:MAG: sugar phosphate isomerase/epimerase [Kiritimatiellae bacterium]|nr:sugar phosphate isomerase/epimerase [Kiritimatiellia bacterium]
MIPTLFSVSYAGLWGQHRLDLKDFVRKAAQLGYSAVELMGKRPHVSVIDCSYDYLAEVRAEAEKAGVEIATVAAYTNFTGERAFGEIPFIEMQVAYVLELAEMGKTLGAKIVRVFSGYATDPDDYHHDWHVCVRALRECAEIAKDYGILIGLQNHHDIGVGCETFQELLAEVDHPNCKAMYDPWAPALHGDDLYRCAKTMAPLMIQTTLADYVKLRRFKYRHGITNYVPLPDMVRAVPLGHGFVDLDAFFSGLKEGGFSGYVAYEMCSPLRGGGGEANLDATAKTSLEKIKQLIGNE